jgi:hypothetical protein
MMASSEGTPEVDRDVRIDELWKFMNAVVGSNVKRTYDEYQNDSLRQVRAIDKQIDDLHTVRVQILSNMADNSNLAAKRCLDHWDKADILNNNTVGVVCDAAVDQSPPDEGVRQAKTE